MPNQEQAAQVQAARKRKQQLDERLDTGERGKYSDRIKIDPFAKGYKFPADRRPISRG